MKIEWYIFILSMDKLDMYFFLKMQLNNSIASNTTFQETDYNTYKNVTQKQTHTIFAFLDNLWFVPKLSAV